MIQMERPTGALARRPEGEVEEMEEEEVGKRKGKMSSTSSNNKLDWEKLGDTFIAYCPNSKNRVFKSVVYKANPDEAGVIEWGVRVGDISLSAVKGIWFGSAPAAMAGAERAVRKIYEIGMREME